MKAPAFARSRLSRILSSSGRLAKPSDLARSYGRKALTVTGAHSFPSPPRRPDWSAARFATKPAEREWFAAI